jgi:L-rhamnose mutarotase
MNRRYCLALDLKDDPQLISEYERHHQAVWPEICRSIAEAGILDMEIYRVANRLFMVIEVSADFSFAAKQTADLQNPAVRRWEELMWKYQKPLGVARPGEKWILMSRIFSLRDSLDCAS